MAGCVAAQRNSVVATTSSGVEFSFHATWYCTDKLDPAWPLGATGWRVTVDGDAPFTIELPFPIEVDQLAAVTPGYTAHPAVNAVAAVCEAPPGFAAAADLPPGLSTRL